MDKFVYVFLLAAVLNSCRPGASPAVDTKGGQTMAITVQSGAFANGETIPKRYTCSGENISPPLSWTGVPDTVVTLALICEDPDAPRGIWTHWVLYNLPAKATGLPEDVPKKPVLENGAQQGLNDSRTIGYDGPCPPPGPAHRYYYKIYALDTHLTLKGNVHRKELLLAMEGHILAQGEVMGRFGR